MTGMILFSSTFEICDLTRPIARYLQENLHAAGCHHSTKQDNKGVPSFSLGKN